jgi:hypothetical protein
MPKPGRYTLEQIQNEPDLLNKALCRGARDKYGNVIMRPSKLKWTKYKLTQLANELKSSGGSGNSTMEMGAAVVPIPVVGHIAGPILFIVGAVICAGAGVCKTVVECVKF